MKNKDWHKTPSSHKNDVQSVADGDKLGYTSVIFIDLRLKFDEIYYCDLLLSQHLLPAIPQVSGEFTFQQDSAPAC